MNEYTHINRDKIIEMYIKKPYESKKDDIFNKSSHGWQVIAITSSITITVDKDSEQECKEFIDKFEFIKV